MQLTPSDHRWPFTRKTTHDITFNKADKPILSFCVRSIEVRSLEYGRPDESSGDQDQGWIVSGGGMASAALLLWENPTIRTATLLVIPVWCFCRCYYCAFYVIEHYVDPSYRFSGPASFVRYVLRSRRAGGAAKAETTRRDT
jgi:hypothetical protein